MSTPTSPDITPAVPQVNIGVLAATSGAGSAAGAEAVRGAQLAVDLVNKVYPNLAIPLAPESGLAGLSGASLKLLVGDTKGTRDQAETQVDALVQKHAAGLIITGSAETAAAVGAASSRLGLPVIDACTSAGYLPEMGMDWYFRTSPTDRALAETTLALLDDHLRGRDAPEQSPAIALMSEDDGQSAAQAALIRELAERAGYVVNLTVSLSPHAPVQTAAAAIDERQPVALVALADTGAQAATATQIAKRARWNAPVIGMGKGFTSLDGVPAGVTLMRATSWSAEYATRNPLAYAIEQLYQHRFGRPMSQTAAASFTATITLATAINAAGSTGPSAIRTGLRRLWLPGTQTIMPWNGVRFGPNGQNDLAVGVVEAFIGKRYRVVFPRELADTPLTWPTPGTTQ